LKKRRAQEFTASNCIAPYLCEKNVASFSTLAVDFIFFIDEKIFTVAPPVNNQNDCVYVPTTRYQPTLPYPPDFQQTTDVSTAVSKLGCSGLVLCKMIKSRFLTYLGLLD